MKIKDPFSHKCPVCLDDIYEQHKHVIFEGFYKNKPLECKRCQAKLNWKKNLSYKLMRVALYMIIALSLLFPVLLVCMDDKMIMKILVVLFLIFISAALVMFLVSAFFIKIIKVNE